MATLVLICQRCDRRMDAYHGSNGVSWYACRTCDARAELGQDGGFCHRDVTVRLDTPDGPAPVRVPSVN